ncbi:cAMP-binding domain of CRP or a regulatory subunit of cAMP-dependent protein kinases [Marinobacter daqiaonensis]|uniref:cAMP-binding domain of CRP or a regulatory subunit of cAMP-dependent protein kinases n=1 Tax=Marinobacter daqiaonensis TaxID=650891 RepID=A0A1I6HPF9_9GAMM|nr:Crp/Fnr family transcriptional regulator [Marinobacter daqiaonensis]SFR56274.1 cAMP-binding domain of CRP or a regulatory subunit of cAMP-dependent protein kinases [Marinobacter daqiaonensis]
MALAQASEKRYEKPVLLAANRPFEADGELASLQDHALFSSLEPQDLDHVLQHSRRVRLGHHQLLYRQDMPAHHFFFVISGRLRLYRLDASGIDRTLDSLLPGDCFAEVMIYADPPRYACYAEALKNSEVLMIPVSVYQDLLDRKPVYARAALQHYAMRAVSRFHDLEIMTVQNARDRLIRYLIDLLPEESRNQGGEVELPLPKCLVASRLAMQPETFSRILADLKSNGLVRVNRSKLFISDPIRLTQISQ